MSEALRRHDVDDVAPTTKLKWSRSSSSSSMAELLVERASSGAVVSTFSSIDVCTEMKINEISWVGLAHSLSTDNAKRKIYIRRSSICVSVRASVTSRYCVKTAERIQFVFLHKSFFRCYKKIWVSSNIRVCLLPSGTLFHTLNLEIFRHGTSKRRRVP